MKDSKEELKSKAAAGVAALGIKRVIIQIIFTAGNIFLARLLFPSDFGTFAIVGSIGALFSVFADLGLAASLVQKKGEIKISEIKSAFTTQLILGLAIAVLVNGLSNILASFFNLSEIGVRLLRFYSLIFLIIPFRQIPIALLERNLDFQKIVFVEVAATALGSALTVVGAFLSFGVYSFALGLIGGHLAAALLYLVILRWPLGFYFPKSTILKLGVFGFSYQANIILGLFWGPLIILYLGREVGPENLGFFQFAASLSVMPLAVSEIVNRIVFPLGSRVQGDRDFFKRILERSIAIVSLTALPAAFLMLAAAKDIIHFVYTDRWLASLPALYFGILQMAIVAYTGVFSQILLSRGLSSVVRNMGIFWAALTWILGPVLIAKFNFVGLSMTSFIVSATGLWFLFKFKKIVAFSFWSNFYPYLISSIVSALVIWVFLILLPTRFVSLIFSLAIGASFYLILIYILRKSALLENLNLIMSIFKKG